MSRWSALVRFLLLLGALPMSGVPRSEALLRVESGQGLKRTFGATGDGRADDTAALLRAAASGLDVELEEGTYLFRTGFSLTNGQTWWGHGQASVLKYAGNGDAITVRGTTPYSRAALERFAFATTGKPNSLIRIEGHNTRIHRVIFDQCGADGCKGIWNVSAYNTRIDGCVFERYTGTAIHLAQSANDATFSYNVSVLGTEVSNTAGHGLVVEGGGAISLQSCILESCSLGAVLLASNWTTFPIRFQDCYFEGNGAYEVRLDSAPEPNPRWARATFEGCRFTLPSPGGIQFNGKGVLVMRECKAVSRTLLINQLHSVPRDQAWVHLDECLGVIVNDVSLGQPFNTGPTGNAALTLAPVAVPIRRINAPGTYLLNPYEQLIQVDCTTGDVTLDFYRAAFNGNFAVPRIEVIRTDASVHVLKVRRTGIDTIDDGVTATLPGKASRTYISDGVGAWRTLAGHN